MQQRRRKGVPSLLQYQQLKAAAGGSGAGSGGRGGPGLRQLRERNEIAVHIVAAIPGGYLIKVANFTMPTYLVSDAHIEPGQEILAQFLCIRSNSLIFCPIAGL